MTEPHRATPEQEINELIAVTVYGPDGGDTPSVASAWEVAKLISGLTAHVAALREEMRDRTDTLAAADGDTTSLIFKVTNRIEALEAAQLEQAEVRALSWGIVRRVEALEASRSIGNLTAAANTSPPTTRLHSYKVAKAEPIEDWGKGHTLVNPEAPTPELRATSAEVQPAASEIFPVEYADANGEGIRIIMEPADETGRVCWVVRNSRRVNPIYEFPTPEAAYAAHQARAEDEGNHD
jgi:hypothetical protein